MTHQRTHECAHPACHRQVLVDRFACAHHWYQLPGTVRTPITKTWLRFRRDLATLDELRAAQQRGLDWWEGIRG